MEKGAETKVRTTWAQRLLLMALGFLLLVGLEFGLRLLGLGGHPPLVIPLEESAAPGAPRLHQVNPRVVADFFPRSGPGGGRLQGSIRPTKLELPKPPDTLRVVYLGESTVEGFPMPRNLTSAAFLQTMLTHTLPGRRVEVVNLGVTAVASFPIRKLAELAIPTLEPDLVVIYGAHNEYFGAGGQASFQSLGHSVAAMRLNYGLRGLALYRLIEEVFSTAGPRQPEGGEERDEQLIQVMAAVPEVPPSSELHARARRSLEENFAAIVRLAHRREVPVVLAAVASNERGFVPVASSIEDLSIEDRAPAEIDSFRRRLEELVGADLSSPEVRAELEAMTERAPGHAAAHFFLGRALDAAGEYFPAAEHYRLARDLDAMPWRAQRDKNEVLRELARREGASLADCEASFSEAAGGTTPGWRFFADHVHPSLEGQALLAKTILEAISARDLLPIDPEREAALPPWQAIAASLGANPLERYRLAHMMATLFQGPPLGTANSDARELFENLAEEIRAGLTPVELEAVVRWEKASKEAGKPLGISFFALANGVRRADAALARHHVRAAILESEPWGEVRSAAYLLDALMERYDPRDPAAAEVKFHRYLAEVERVETFVGQPTALLAATLSGFHVLKGDLENAERYDELRSRLEAEAPAPTDVYLEEIPDLRAWWGAEPESPPADRRAK